MNKENMQFLKHSNKPATAGTTNTLPSKRGAPLILTRKDNKGINSNLPPLPQSKEDLLAKQKKSTQNLAQKTKSGSEKAAPLSKKDSLGKNTPLTKKTKENHPKSAHSDRKLNAKDTGSENTKVHGKSSARLSERINSANARNHSNDQRVHTRNDDDRVDSITDQKQSNRSQRAKPRYEEESKEEQFDLLDHDEETIETFKAQDAKLVSNPISKSRAFSQGGKRQVDTKINNLEFQEDGKGATGGKLISNKTPTAKAGSTQVSKAKKPTMNKSIANQIELTSSDFWETLCAGLEQPKRALNEFAVDKPLGQGSYAVVKLAKDKSSGQKCAIKTYEKYKLTDAQRRQNLKREVTIMGMLDHENIIKLLGTVDTTKQLHLVMEFGGVDSLCNYLKAKKYRCLEEDEAKLFFRQTVEGIDYMHKKNIAHRDIKLENILIDGNHSVKIIDFGFSILSQKGALLNIYCGTPSYMSPELAMKKNYQGWQADIWALGVLLYVLLCGRFPFMGMNDRELFQRISQGKFDIPPHVSPDARALLNKIIRVNPHERPTCDTILKDKWIC